MKQIYNFVQSLNSGLFVAIMHQKILFTNSFVHIFINNYNCQIVSPNCYEVYTIATVLK